jgi:hypothetical protein
MANAAMRPNVMNGAFAFKVMYFLSNAVSQKVTDKELIRFT